MKVNNIMKKSLMIIGGYTIGAFALIGLKICVQYVIDSIDCHYNCNYKF